MSQYYMADDIVLWNPSSGVSRVFLGQVRLFEDELSLPSGVGPMQDDECQVDVEQFTTFAEALLTYSRASNHHVLHALSDGFAITVLALAERAGIEVPHPASPAANTTYRLVADNHPQPKPSTN